MLFKPGVVEIDSGKLVFVFAKGVPLSWVEEEFGGDLEVAVQRAEERLGVGRRDTWIFSSGVYDGGGFDSRMEVEDWR